MGVRVVLVEDNDVFRETLELLLGLGDRVRWVRGNGDRELATGGTWTAERLSAEQRSLSVKLTG